MKAPGRLIVASALLVFTPASADAFESVAQWSTNEVAFKVNPKNLDVPDAAALAAILSSAQAWTTQSHAAFHFKFDGVSTSTTAGLNGENLILFRDEEGSSPTVRASTMTWKIGSKIIETDMVFWDKSLHFITLPTACVDSIYIENTAIHEFGHALGLEHTAIKTATMYGSAPFCAKDRLDLDPDDVAGVESLYPCQTASQCNDDDACTNDTCQSGKCQRTKIAGCCAKDSDCDDGDACTTDACVAKKCTHSPTACTADAGTADAGSPNGTPPGAKPGADDPGGAGAREPGLGAPETADSSDGESGCSTTPAMRERGPCWVWFVGTLAAFLITLRRRRA